MKRVAEKEREVRKNMLLAVMMTIVVCGIMLTMYYINNKLHPTHKDDVVSKEKVSQNLDQSASDATPLIDIHSLLSFKLGF